MPTLLKDVFNVPGCLAWGKLAQLYSYAHGSFLGFRKTTEYRHRFWTPTVKTGVPTTDEQARGQGVARYSSTPALHMEEMECAPILWVARRRALLDDWVGWLVAFMGVDSDGPRWLPKTGGRFPCTGEGVPRQYGHKDIKVGRRAGIAYFAIVTGSENTALYVCPVTHEFFFESAQTCATLCKTLRIE